ncbi:MAG: hypothetical protein WA004_15245 [Saprospiraceae bacterium]
MAQQPDVVDLVLSDGTPVTLVQQHGIDTPEGIYHYLPVNMRISSANGRPEFSFLAFRPDSLSPISGGVMHLLLVWGLDNEQLEEAESLLVRKADSTAILAGSGFMETDDLHPEPEIEADSNAFSNLLLRSLRSTSKTPSLAGSKTAMSFYFNAEDAQLMEEALQYPERFKGIRFKMYFAINNRFYGEKIPFKWMLEGDFEKWLKQLR